MVAAWEAERASAREGLPARHGAHPGAAAEDHVLAGALGAAALCAVRLRVPSTEVLDLLTHFY